MRSIDDLINKLVKEEDSMYIPGGVPTWRLPTGLVSLDKVLGGGIPGGTLTQIFGLEQSGKTSLAYHITAQAVKQGLETLLIPLENYSSQYAQACGIDINAPNFHKVAGDFAEIVFNTCITLVRETDIKVVVMDSISAATPKGNLEKEQPIKDFDKGPKIGAHAALVGDFAKKLQSPLRRKQVIFICVNQVRPVIGVFSKSTIYKPTGGYALQYYTDFKLEMYPRANYAAKEIVSTVTLRKGKDFDVVPYGTTSLAFKHGLGVDVERDLMEYCITAEIIKKSGSWFYYGDIKSHGINDLLDAIKADNNLKEELLNKAKSANIAVKIDEEVKNADENEGTDVELEPVS